MTDDLSLNIEFLINNPEVRAQAQQVRAQITDIVKTSDAAIERMVRNSIQDKQAREQVILALKAEKEALRQAAEEAKRLQQINDNSAKSARGLGMSINQISRELPAFTYSAQTGFMAIANNIPMLTDEIKRLKAANAELTASGGQATPVWKQLLGAVFSWQTALSIGLTVITVYGREIGNLITSLFKGKDALLNLTKGLKDVADARLKGVKDAQQELTELNRLYNATQNQNLSLKERNRAVDELQQKYPAYFSNLSNEAVLAGNAKTAYNELSEAIISAAKARAAEDKMVDLSKQELDLLDKKTKYQVMIARHEKEIGQAAKERRVTGMGGSSAAAQTMGLSAQIQADNESIALLDRQIASIKERKKKLSDVVNEETVKSGVVRPGQLTNEEKKADSEAKKAQNAAEKAARQFAAIVAGRKDMQDKITALDNEYKIKSFQSDEEEVAALKEKFRKFRDTIEKENEKLKAYNLKVKDPRKKQAIFDVGAVNDIETRAVNDLVSKQAVEAEKATIQQLKQLYDQYETYKLEFGKAKADERFQGELKGYTDYVSYIKGQLESLNGKDDAGSNSLKDFFTAELPKAQKAASDKAFDNNLKDLKRIQDASRTAATEQVRINEQYDKDLATLRLNYVGEELAAKEAALAQHHQTELDGLKRIAFEASEVGKALATDLFFKTREEIEVQVKKVKELLKTEDLTPLQKKALKDNLGTLDQALDDTNQFAKVAAHIADSANQIGSALSSLGDAIGGDAGHTIGQLGGMLGIAGNAAGAAASFATGDIIGGATKALGVVTGLFSMGKKVKEMNAQARAEVQAFYDRAAAGELNYQALLRERARKEAEESSSRLKGMKEEYNLLLQQQKDLDSQAKAKFDHLLTGNFAASMDYEHGTWLRKAKTTVNYESLAGKTFKEIEELDAQGKIMGWEKEVFDSLVRLKNEGADVNRALKELENTVNEIFTGTTSDTLRDTFGQMFRDGKTSAQDFADFFQKTMQDASYSIFEHNVLASMIDEFYKEFTEKSKSGNQLTASEMSELKDMYDSMGEEAKKEWEALQKVTGIGFNGSENAQGITSNKISRSITEETGSELIGLQRGTYDYTKKHYQTAIEGLSVMKQLLLVQQQTAANTGLTAERLLVLESLLAKLDLIAKQTSGTSLRGAGLG